MNDAKTAALPELPEPDYWSTRDDDTPLYTADQMRAYALAALQPKPAAKCDGNHGGPRCADPECWNDSPAQPAAPGVTGAVQTLIEALKADPEYAWAWHCNVAMAAVDEGLSHYAANKAAARFLSWLAQIDTTAHPGFPKAPEQPAAAVSDAEIDRIASENTYSVEHPTRFVTDARATVRALRPQAVPMPEPVQRLSRYAGQTMRTARNPNITAREAIEIGDYLAANGITAQAKGGDPEDLAAAGVMLTGRRSDHA